MIVQQTLSTPVGELRLLSNGAALVGVYFPDHRAPSPGPLPEATPKRPDPILNRAIEQLREYFDGRRRRFTIPVALAGTEFQRAVWTALTSVEYGRTCSYAALAEAVGRPRAARALGAANARNPLSLILPCHRVVGSDGALTGYAGGLARKQWLLEHERRSGLGA